jgi:CheY-like chemotaxis protein
MEELKSSGVHLSWTKKILVVDDNPDAAELVSSLLLAQGHDVRSAHTAQEALLVAQEFQPELAFLDIGLPAMDGFELALALRALPNLDQCRLIAITGYDDAADRRRSKQVGFEAHLLKPIAMDTLERVLQPTADRRRTKRGP